MFESIPIELYHSEAEVMDSIYEGNRSIKKQIDVLNSSKDMYSPDQVTYLTMLFITDYLDKDPQNIAAIDKILNGINFNTVDVNVLLALLKLLKATQHLYKNHTAFVKNSVTRFTEFNLDSDKILADI